MKPRTLALALLIASPLPALAQAPTIDHQPVACAAVDRFPRLEARFSPAESVATARLVFQGQTAEWYSVAMKPEGALFAGVLPKPKKDLKSFRYYIEVTDKALGTNRTAEFTTSVVESAGACKGRLMAGALGSASVILQGPAGVVALPAGFASTGVVAGSAAGSSAAAGAAGASGAAGGGGLSATTIGVVGGAVVAGAVVATQVVGGGETYSGTFQMTTVMTARNGAGQVLCSAPLTIAGNLRIEDFDGGGHLVADWTETQTGGNCSYPDQVDRVDGDLDSSSPESIRFSRTFSGTGSTGLVTRTRSFAGALSGDAIQGTWTMSFDFQANAPSTRTESYPPTGAAVTLRKQ